MFDFFKSLDIGAGELKFKLSLGVRYTEDDESDARDVDSSRAFLEQSKASCKDTEKKNEQLPCVWEENKVTTELSSGKKDERDLMWWEKSEQSDKDDETKEDVWR